MGRGRMGKGTGTWPTPDKGKTPYIIFQDRVFLPGTSMPRAEGRGRAVSEGV